MLLVLAAYNTCGCSNSLPSLLDEILSWASCIQQGVSSAYWEREKNKNQKIRFLCRLHDGVATPTQSDFEAYLFLCAYGVERMGLEVCFYLEAFSIGRLYYCCFARNNEALS